MNEFCDLLVSHLSVPADALLDVTGNVNLDIYINSLNSGIVATEQEGSTCYANAVAYVFYLAMKRVVGHVVPEFDAIRTPLKDKYGPNGANTREVLQNESIWCADQC